MPEREHYETENTFIIGYSIPAAIWMQRFKFFLSVISRKLFLFVIEREFLFKQHEERNQRYRSIKEAEEGLQSQDDLSRFQFQLFREYGTGNSSFKQ
jgi:hypothetical protein